MRILLIAATFFMSEITFAQQQKMSIGLETGPSMIILRGNNFNTVNNHPGIGFLAGASFQYNFQRKLSVRTGVDFERKGGNVNGIYTDHNGNAIAQSAWPNHFDYLTIPVLMRAAFGKKMNGFADAGVSCGYLIKQTVVYKGINEGEYNSRNYVDNTAHYKNIDPGIIAGIGISIPVKKEFAFSLELRDNLGLRNLNYGNAQVVKTNSTNLIIGFAYNWGELQKGSN